MPNLIPAPADYPGMFWFTFETMMPDGGSSIYECVCDERTAKMRAANLLRRHEKAQAVFVFPGHDGSTGPLWHQKWRAA